MVLVLFCLMLYLLSFFLILLLEDHPGQGRIQDHHVSRIKAGLGKESTLGLRVRHILDVHVARIAWESHCAGRSWLEVKH